MVENILNFDTNDPSWKGILKIACIAAFLQLGYIFLNFFVLFTISGESPKTALDYYTLIQNDPIKALLLIDTASVILLFLYYFTSFGIFVILSKNNVREQK